MKHSSIKPCGERYSNILGDPEHVEILEPDENGHFKLDSKNCYVFKLKEGFTPHLLNNEPIYGQATAKSSVGALPVKKSHSGAFR